jgi:hypothetical protein
MKHDGKYLPVLPNSIRQVASTDVGFYANGAFTHNFNDVPVDVDVTFEMKQKSIKGFPVGTDVAEAE